MFYQDSFGFRIQDGNGFHGIAMSSFVILSEIERKSTGTIQILIAINADQRVASLIQRSLQTDHYELECIRRVGPDVVSNLGNISVVEGRIDFVKHEERRRLVTVDRKKKGKRSNCFFASGKLFHIPEPFHRRHGVILDTSKVWFLAVPTLGMPHHQMEQLCLW